ncbi:MAG: xanthine dehydrogenase [Deltaproteobacteria bacterium]|nr:xanthine dehydrogenase [Deltaproteobacteria bacterium]
MDSTKTTEYRYLGKRALPVDGQDKLLGQLNFTGDLKIGGMLHVRLMLSPHPHARIISVDRTAAQALPGVVAVLTAEDLPTRDQVISSRMSAVLAKEKVLFEGQPVVAVVGETVAAAQDGVEALEVAYELLPAIPNLDAALSPESPILWPYGLPKDAIDVSADHGGVEQQSTAESSEPSNIHTENKYARGDVEQGFQEADVVLERTYRIPAVHQGYLEPQIAVAAPEGSSGLVLYVSTQGPRTIRNEVARLLRLARSQVRVVPMPMGGGFGGKHGLLEPLVAAVAHLLHRPVRLELTRTEDFLTSMPAPEHRIDLKMGVKQDSQLCALEAKLYLNNGAFSAPWSGLAATLLASQYLIPHIKISANEVCTTQVMTGPYRAPSAPQAVFAMESHMDDLARELEIDPLEFRYQNASGGGDAMITGNPWPSLSFREVLDKMREHPAWANRENRPDEGIGLAAGVWGCNTAPASAVVRVESDGSVQVLVGSVDISGVNSGFVHIVAETLGVLPEQVTITQGDTTSGPAAPVSGGSMVTYSVAGALADAAGEVRQRVTKMAAEHFEASEQDIEIEEGKVFVRGVRSKAVTLAEFASRAESTRGQGGPLLAHGNSAVEVNAPVASVHLVRVRVDKETGVVTPLQYVAVQDVGFALNPLMVEGQLQGGALQGLAIGLQEQLVYDDDGHLLTPSFLDYALPRCDEAPSVEPVLVEVASPKGPFGIRGVGEPPIVPGPAALANAVRDATGIRVKKLPIRAPELWEKMQN